MKQRSWLAILLSFAGPCRGKLVLSVICAIISVVGGFVPYLGVYEIWCGIKKVDSLFSRIS